jgi:hypothetical protein
MVIFDLAEKINFINLFRKNKTMKIKLMDFIHNFNNNINFL